MNLAIICGNLGADPELVSTQGGMSILKLRVATNDRRKKGEQWEEHTEWHRAKLFGTRATALHGILIKGTNVTIRGHIETSTYDKEGQKHYSTEIIVDDIEINSGGARKQEAAAPPAQAQPRPEPPHPRTQIPAGHVWVPSENKYDYRPDLNLPPGEVVDAQRRPIGGPRPAVPPAQPPAPPAAPRPPGVPEPTGPGGYPASWDGAPAPGARY